MKNILNINKKSKGKLVFGAIVLVIILGISFIVFQGSTLVKENKQLGESIITRVKISEFAGSTEISERIDFRNELVSEDWDAMYVITPYLNPNKFLKDNGITKYKIESNLEHDDSKFIIAFAKGDKLVTYTTIPIAYLNDSNIETKYKYEECKLYLGKKENQLII